MRACADMTGACNSPVIVQVEEVPPFSNSTNQVLDDIVSRFGLEGALDVKEVSCTTFRAHLRQRC